MNESSPLLDRKYGASPLLVLALLGAVGGGTVYTRHEETVTAMQVQTMSEARSRYEALQQHCVERYSDLMQKYLAPR